MRARRPGLERLEGRALLAGNVTTGFLGKALLVTGDAADNAIEVNQDGLGPGQYRIVGLEGTTVDGKIEVVVRARQDLHIDLGDGRDEAFAETSRVSPRRLHGRADSRLANRSHIQRLTTGPRAGNS